VWLQVYGQQILENFSKISQVYCQQQPWQPTKKVKISSLLLLSNVLELLGKFVEEHCILSWKNDAKDHYACK
jgi:hypothetical protein